MDMINKTNNQLHKEFEAALRKLEEKTYNLLHYGSYQLNNIGRDWKTNKVDTAMMDIGEHKVFLAEDEHGGTSVTIHFEDNPINQKMLEAWDYQTIDRDIKYHREKLAALEELKKENILKLQNCNAHVLD